MKCNIPSVKKFFLFATLFLLLTIFSGSNIVFAQIPTETPVPTPTPDTSSQDKINELQSQISDLQKKIADAQSQAQTLSSQIAIMDNQINLTELRINATKQQIAGIVEDIKIATKKIVNLEGSLQNLTKILLNRIVVTYEVGTIQPFQVLLVSNTASDFFTRLNYLRIAQMHDKELLYQTQQAKMDYANQKTIFEDKKKKVETLKNQLTAYSAQLDQEKKAKQALLEVTKNDEKRYQQLLAQLKAEKSAIEGVVATLQLVNGTPIKEGESIAVVGNSGTPGCSTGPHLHFEVRKNGVPEDPSAYLRSGVSFRYSYNPDQYDYYGSINPRGGWNWPLNDTVVINQGYGTHGYARSFYPGGFHNGIDMESDSSDTIKAPKDGTLYKGTTHCGSSPMNYVAVDHGDGIISWYWHVR